MGSKQPYNLSLELNPSTLSLFPDAIGKKDASLREAVSKRVRTAFTNLKGVVQSLTVSNALVRVVWQYENHRTSYLDQIAKILSKGNYADGILLLELFLSNEPENPDLLYNLGMAYSDQNQLKQAIALLTKLIKTEPEHVNGRVALGVALARSHEDDDAIRELQIAIEKAPQNLWAHRNLGAALMHQKRYSEALEHLRLATEIDANDQAAWFGYGQALGKAEKLDEADQAYLKTIDIDEFSNIAELARKERSKLAQDTFHSRTPGIERMDAVMYCLGALQKFADMTSDEVQKIGFEIAMLGTRGLDVNDSTPKYTLHSLPGKFSGLHLVSIEYVAFKQLMPAQDIGFDLSKEYRMAISLFEKNPGKE